MVAAYPRGLMMGSAAIGEDAAMRSERNGGFYYWIWRAAMCVADWATSRQWEIDKRRNGMS